MLVVVGLVYFVLFAYLIANYVIRAIGLYRIAKQSRAQNPWLAWVPYADLYLLGKITGDVSLGKRRLEEHQFVADFDSDWHLCTLGQLYIRVL